MGRFARLFGSLGRRAGELRRRAEGELYALYLAWRDPRTPWYARVAAAAVVLYALSPVDLIPDFIPVLGYLDDLILVPLGIAIALRLVPPDIMAESRRRAREALERNAVRTWPAVLLVALLWAALLGLVIWRLVRLFGRKPS